MRRAAALLLLAAAAAGGWEDVRREFARRYADGAEAEERLAALAELAKSDLAPAAELLLKVWENLARDAEKLRKETRKARDEMADARRALHEGKGRRERLEERIAALHRLDLDGGRRLARMEREMAAVLDGLRTMKSAEVLDWLAEKGLDRAEEWPLLEHAVASALATSRAAGADAVASALDKTRDPARLVPLLQALGARGAELEARHLELLVGALAHEDWAVRVAAAHAVARAGKPEGVEPLLLAMTREPEDSRARLEMTRALRVLTGENHGPYPDVWTRWWSDKKAEILAGRVPLGRGAGEIPGTEDAGLFYGIPQTARRILYVLDVSGSMDVSMENPQWVDGRAVPAADDEDSRLDAARKELVRAAGRLRPGTRYGVIAYSSHVDPVMPDLGAASPERRDELAKRLDERFAEGSTNVYAALDYALRLANVHPDTARGEPAVDAVYLVSDGSPTDADGKTEDPERTLLAVRQWNAEGRVAIYTVGIGAEHNRAFLKRLAEENGGAYYPVVPKKRR